MHDIWNPWHGCEKCSEGCQNCYMYYLDRMRGLDSSARCTRTASFDYPIRKNRRGAYQIQSGELIRVCMTSDFFWDAADPWRGEAWELIRQRPDVKFFLLTKRPQRVSACLPKDWGDGWDNVFFNVTCENQRRADERMPLLLALPFKHKGVMTAPLIGSVSLAAYLTDGQVEQVICGGENYDGSRPCRYEWVKRLSDECKAANVTFSFIETGTHFEKDGREYVIPSKRTQAEQAYASGLSYRGRPIAFRLTTPLGVPIPSDRLYVPHYREHCARCGGRLTCNGCGDCGRCKGRAFTAAELDARA